MSENGNKIADTAALDRSVGSGCGLTTRTLRLYGSDLAKRRCNIKESLSGLAAA